jgi:DNA-binding NarL/FixJ family response regulator
LKKILIIEQAEIYLNGIKRLLELHFHELSIDVTLIQQADFYLTKKYELVFIYYEQSSDRKIIDAFINQGFNVVLVSRKFKEEMWEDVAYKSISGFLLANMKTEAFFQAVEMLLEGDEFYHPKVLSGVLQHLRRTKPQFKKNRSLKMPDSITPREQDVYRKLVAGYSTNEIAEQLHLSDSTVGLYISKLIKKTKTKDRVSLVLLAIKYQWFDDEIIV